MNEVISRDTLEKALTKVYPKQEAKEYADIVLTYSGFNFRFIDNIVSNKEDRAILYKLENRGILGTAREELTYRNTGLWTVYYWTLNRHEINKLSNGCSVTQEKKKEDPYASVPNSVFRRH